MRHFSRHWHHHLALWCGLAAALFLAATAATAYTRYSGHGFVPGPLPPPVRYQGALPLPQSWWLNRYIVRVHNQGNSNSCVGQTLATMEELTQARRDNPKARWHKKFSAGFIWNQINGGANAGVTYEAAFHVLTTEGDARLKDFPADGLASDYWQCPTVLALRRALPYRFVTWRSILPTDRDTIRFELMSGRPIAAALPILSSFYNHWRSSSWITGESGSFLFWHSMTITGYNPCGVELLNSWGPDWGDHGHAMITWQALAAAGAELVVATPRKPISQVHIPKLLPTTPIKGGRP